MSQNALDNFGAYRKARERFNLVVQDMYVRFLDFARGSARETRGRHERKGCWLDECLVQQRVRLADEIIGILTSSIETLRNSLQSAPDKTTYLREEAPIYGSDDYGAQPPDPPPSTLDPRPPPLPPPPST